MYWVVLGLMLILLIPILMRGTQEYTIPLGHDYFVDAEPPLNDPTGGPSLRHEGLLIVRDLRKYAVAGSLVVGEARQGFFIARPEGELQFSKYREEWLNAVRERESVFTGELRAPSMFDSSACGIVLGAVTITVAWISLGCVIWGWPYLRRALESYGDYE